MWQPQRQRHQQRGGGRWPPPAPARSADEGGEHEARRRELRDFIALRREALGAKGAVPPAQPQPQPQPVRRAFKPSRALQHNAQLQPPTSWHAIKQQAHQGFQQLLIQAGLPVNAGLSRPASLTAAGLQHHHARQQQRPQSSQHRQQQYFMQQGYMPADQDESTGWNPGGWAALLPQVDPAQGAHPWLLQQQQEQQQQHDQWQQQQQLQQQQLQQQQQQQQQDQWQQKQQQEQWQQPQQWLQQQQQHWQESQCGHDALAPVPYQEHAWPPLQQATGHTVPLDWQDGWEGSQASEAHARPHMWPPQQRQQQVAHVASSQQLGSPGLARVPLPLWTGSSHTSFRSSLGGVDVVKPAALKAAIPAGRPCSQAGMGGSYKQQHGQALLKQDSDVAASRGWQAGDLAAIQPCAASREQHGSSTAATPLPGALCSQPAGASAAAEPAARHSSRNGSGSGWGRSSGSGSGVITAADSLSSSSVLEALATAAEEGDVPMLGPESWEEEEGAPGGNAVEEEQQQQPAEASAAEQEEGWAEAHAVEEDEKERQPAGGAATALADHALPAEVARSHNLAVSQKVALAGQQAEGGLLHASLGWSNGAASTGPGQAVWSAGEACEGELNSEQTSARAFCALSLRPASELPQSDPSAAAALARFEQLQQQLRQLQAGLPPMHAAAVLTASPNGHVPCSPLAPAVPSQSAANSPVHAVMQQAESFLAQAQSLLQHLQGAAASPPPQPATLQAHWAGQQPRPAAQLSRLGSPVLPAAQQARLASLTQQAVQQMRQSHQAWEQEPDLSACSELPPLGAGAHRRPASQAYGMSHNQAASSGAEEVACALPSHGWEAPGGAAEHVQQWQSHAWEVRQPSSTAAAEHMPWGVPQWEANPRPALSAVHRQQQECHTQGRHPSAAWAHPQASPGHFSVRGGQPAEAAASSNGLPASCGQPRQPGMLKQQQKLQSLSYAQRQHAAVAAAAVPAPVMQVACAKQDPGSYVHAARLARERASREAAERDELRRQNEAAKLAARQRSHEKQRQQEEQAEQEQSRGQQQRQRQLLGGTGSAYLQKLRGRLLGKQKHEQVAVPGWARAARPLPPLLPAKGSGMALLSVQQVAVTEQQQQQELINGSQSALAHAPSEEDSPLQQQQQQLQQPQQAVTSVSPPAQAAQPSAPNQGLPPLHQQAWRHRMSEDECELQAALAELDARMAQRTAGFETRTLSSSTAGLGALGSGSAAGQQALSLDLPSRSNSVLQQRLQDSLDRLDGELAEVAGRAQHAQHAPETQEGACSPPDALEEAEPWPPQEHKQWNNGLTAVVSAASAATAAAVAESGSDRWQAAEVEQAGQRGAAQGEAEGSQVLRVAEQLPLRWHLNRRRSLAPMFDRAAAAGRQAQLSADKPPGVEAPSAGAAAAAAAALPVASVATRVQGAAELVCHVTVANVGKQVPAQLVGRLAAAAAGPGSSSGCIAPGSACPCLLPPLHEHQRGLAVGGGTACGSPKLRTAARAAARPAQMLRTLQPNGAAVAGTWWQQQCQQMQQQAQPPALVPWQGWGQPLQQQQQQQAWGLEQAWGQQWPGSWQQAGHAGLLPASQALWGSAGQQQMPYAWPSSRWP